MSCTSSRSVFRILIPLHYLDEPKDRQESSYGPKNARLEPFLKPRKSLTCVDQLTEGLVVFSWETYVHNLVLFVYFFHKRPPVSFWMPRIYLNLPIRALVPSTTKMAEIIHPAQVSSGGGRAAVL